MKTILGLLLIIYCSNGLSQAIARPKLVVGIVVDQMRYDYIYRYWDKYSEDGFRKLVNGGYFFQNTHYNFVPTHTGPGHASVFTGATPSVHGIIANIWYSREKKKMIYCSGDKSAKPVGGSVKAGQMSPRNMLATTIGDQLKLADKQSKVIGIALKDRGSILAAGHAADAAYWFDDSTGNWMSSNFYMSKLPEWVEAFNSKKAADKFLEQTWNTLLPIESYTESLPDDNPYENPYADEKKAVFPYNLPALAKKKKKYDLFRQTPFGNTFTKDFAVEVIRNEQLGQDAHTDMLTLSFSSTDYIGHRFGPQSVEIQDTYLRLDKDIAELLKFLDEQVGRENYLVFLTADHASPETPAYLMKKYIPGGYFNENQLRDSLKKYLKARYGEDMILSWSNQQVFLNDRVISSKKLDKDAVCRDAAGYILGLKGVSEVVTRPALESAEFTTGVRMLMQNGFHQKRSGDILVNYEPLWMENINTGTTHGSPYPYDTHVPLLWYGWKVNKGSSAEKIYITDIALTLSFLLGIETPNGCFGKMMALPLKP